MVSYELPHLRWALYDEDGDLIEIGAEEARERKRFEFEGGAVEVRAEDSPVEMSVSNLLLAKVLHLFR